MSWEKNKLRIRNPQMREVLDRIFTGKDSINVKFAVADAAPIIGVQSTVTIEASELAVMDVDDVIVFEGKTFTRKAATEAADLEFEDAAGLILCINHANGHDDVWTASDSGGDVLITRDVAGILGNDKTVMVDILEDTTSGGDGATTEATASISADTIDEIANGDIIRFAGYNFLKVASTPVAAKGEWDNVTSLVAAIDLLPEWDALVNTGAADITAASNATAYNDYTINVYLYRVTENGVDGTVGEKGMVLMHGTSLYLASDDIGTDNVTIGDWLVIDTTAHS